jgi:hypothetical protein
VDRFQRTGPVWSVTDKDGQHRDDTWWQTTEDVERARFDARTRRDLPPLAARRAG